MAMLFCGGESSDSKKKQWRPSYGALGHMSLLDSVTEQNLPCDVIYYLPRVRR